VAFHLSCGSHYKRVQLTHEDDAEVYITAFIIFTLVRAIGSRSERGRVCSTYGEV
jgi:hypothetical protein